MLKKVLFASTLLLASPLWAADNPRVLLNTSLGRQIAMQRSAVMRRFCQELAVALENGHEDDSPLWLARYIHDHSDTGRLQQQLTALNGGLPGSHRYPASVAPALQILHDEVAGRQ